MTASLEGVFLFGKESAGKWIKTQIGEGNTEEKGDIGAGEVKIGRFRSGRIYIATIEPWHGNQVVVYLPPTEKEDLWERKVLDSKLKQGHALWCADMDDDGDEEIVVGWREPSEAAVMGWPSTIPLTKTGMRVVSLWWMKGAWPAKT